MSSYWFPGTLPHYITRQTISGGTLARLIATVLTGAPATLVALHAPSRDDLLAGGTPLTPEIDCSAEGTYATEYEATPEGEIFVALSVEVADIADLQDLVIGLAEVQIKRS